MKVILCYFFGLITGVGSVCGQTPAGADTGRRFFALTLDADTSAPFRTFRIRAGRQDTLPPHRGMYIRWDALPPFPRVSWRNTVVPQVKRRIGRRGTPPAVLTMSSPSVRIMQPDHMPCVIADLVLLEPMPRRERP